MNGGNGKKLFNGCLFMEQKKAFFSDDFENTRAINILYFTTRYHYTVVKINQEGEETVIGFSDRGQWKMAGISAGAHGFCGDLKVVNNRTGKYHRMTIEDDGDLIF